jgi:PAS domain-containing protein
MDVSGPPAHLFHTPAGRDALVLAVVGVALFLVVRSPDVFEMLMEFASHYEHGEVEEVVIAVLILSAGLAVFSVRRWKEVETEVRVREIVQRRLRLAIEGGSLGIWDWDIAKGEVSLIHDRAKGGDVPSPEEEAHVSTIYQRVHPDDLSLLMKGMEEVKGGTLPYYEAECRERCPGGGWRWVHVMGKVTARDGEGRPVRATGITWDVTEMHRTREALDEANKKLDLLYSITRHDLLNQVSVIAGYAGLIDEEAEKDGKTREYARQVTRATATIRDQIVFMQDYEKMGVNVPEWQCVEKVVRRAGEKASLGKLKVHVSTGRLEVFADPLFEKVVFNLVDNTVRHGDRATEFTVSFHEENDRGILVYEDDGAGIPQSQKEKIFIRGFGRNSGLGLFLVREILGITGMTIRETGSEGKGVRFEILVPAGNFRTHRE